MQIYDYSDTCIMSIEGSDGRLEMITPVLKVTVEGHEGCLQSGERKWQFYQPELIRDVKVSQNTNNGRSEPCTVITLQYENGSENWYLYPYLPFLCIRFQSVPVSIHR